VIIQLEVLSVEPRIFKVRHFLTATEASNLIANAKAVTAKGHRLQRYILLLYIVRFACFLTLFAGVVQ